MTDLQRSHGQNKLTVQFSMDAATQNGIVVLLPVSKWLTYKYHNVTTVICFFHLVSPELVFVPSVLRCIAQQVLLPTCALLYISGRCSVYFGSSKVLKSSLIEEGMKYIRNI